MGLDISHDAFDGAYSAFNRFRQAIARAAGGSFPPHENEGLNPKMWYEGPIFREGLYIFMTHSDCDGEISPDDCIKVANDLEELLPEIEKQGNGGGHLARAGGLGEVTKKLIRGCRKAAEAKEPLIFS